MKVIHCKNCQTAMDVTSSEIKRGRIFCSVACYRAKHVPWNKGKKTGIIPKSAFKKGHVPWSKAVAGTGIKKAWNKGMKFPERSGPNSARWKGGTSRSIKDGYYSTEYKHWRTQVFDRDKYVCQACGSTGGPKNAHHIKPFAQYEDLRFDLNNGICLCVDCHREIHSFERFNHSYSFA